MGTGSGSGEAQAMISLGALYGNGQGVERDLNEAMRWFLKAKAHGADVSSQIAKVMEGRKLQR